MQKEGLIEKLRQALDSYFHVYAFDYDNMRSDEFKKVRAYWKDSRFEPFCRVRCTVRDAFCLQNFHGQKQGYGRCPWPYRRGGVHAGHQQSPEGTGMPTNSSTPQHAANPLVSLTS
jgi:hypothetical protein